MRQILLVTVAVLVAGLANAAAGFDGHSWWDTVKVIADDHYEGRETGSRGERQAQDYIVRQLKAAGVEPGAAGGFFQPVRLRSREVIEGNSRLALIRGGVAEPLTIGEQYILSARVNLAPSVEAPLVFVGYGLDIPERDHHDTAGLDVKGKIVVYFQGSPADIPTSISAHYQAMGIRWRALRAAGAIGLITLPNPSSMDIPWARMSINRTRPSMYLTGEEFDETAGARFAATFNPAFADLLFQGTGHTFAELAAIGAARGAMPRFELPVSVRGSARLAIREVSSRNVVAMVKGSDPALRDQYVVLTAHLDHIGIGAPINGDRINNGAMDNASGCALLLDLARALAKAPQRPKRSVLFVWLTAEEKGLLGSKYYAAHPTVPITSIVANINTDEFLPIVPFKVLTVFGLTESDLGDRVTRLGTAMGIKVQPDPQPLRNVFIRSDQYNFVRRGIPALAMQVAAEPGTPEQAIYDEWVAKRYHAPSDDTNQPVNLEAAGRFEDLTLALTLEVADAAERPAWKPDSFFRRFESAAGAGN